MAIEKAHTKGPFFLEPLQSNRVDDPFSPAFSDSDPTTPIPTDSPNNPSISMMTSLAAIPQRC